MFDISLMRLILLHVPLRFWTTSADSVSDAFDCISCRVFLTLTLDNSNFDSRRLRIQQWAELMVPFSVLIGVRIEIENGVRLECVRQIRGSAPESPSLVAIQLGEDVKPPIPKMT